MKKISLPEIIILVLIAAGADFAGLILNLFASIPVVGIMFSGASVIIGWSAFAIIQIWFILKGIGISRQAWFLIGGLLDTIPAINALPLITPGLLMAIHMINNTGQLGQIAGPAKLAAAKTVNRQESIQ